MQELPHAVHALAQEVVIDSYAAKLEAGDLIGPLSLGVLREENVLHLAERVNGKRSVDTRRTTVVKSAGMALYDLYAARAFVAVAQGIGRGAALESLDSLNERVSYAGCASTGG